MYLRQVIYQMQTKIESLLPCFHRAERRNLASMIVGMVYARSVNLPLIASCVPLAKTQLEARVQRFERVLKCRKLVPLKVLEPVARAVLSSLSQKAAEPLLILMDRSMINDQLNLLWISVGFGRRALPLGWVRVPHEGNSDLALQQEILSWLKALLPEAARAVIVADREFHSIQLARWISQELKLDYVLRIKAGTYIELDGQSFKAGQLAIKGESVSVSKVKVTRAEPNDYLTNLTLHWTAEEDEAWILATNLERQESLRVYERRFWIEEMFSDHKSRGLNLERTRIKEPERLERLVVAMTIAYLWIMEIGAMMLDREKCKKVDNKGAQRSVSICQIGLRWLREMWHEGVLPPLLTMNFGALEKT